MFDIHRFLTEKEYDEEKSRYFDSFSVDDVLYHKQSRFVMIRVNAQGIYPFALYQDLRAYLSELISLPVQLLVKAANEDLPLKEASQYLRFYTEEHMHAFEKACPVSSNGHMVIQYADRQSFEEEKRHFDELRIFFEDIGYHREIVFSVREEVKTPTAVPPLPEAKPEKKAASVFEKKEKSNYYRPRNRSYTELPISELRDTLNDIEISGKIFKVEERSFKNGNIAQTIYIKDDDDACIAKVIEGRRFSREALSQNKEGKYAHFYGSYRFDTFSNDYIFEPDQIEFYEQSDDLSDDAEEKRIELHAHTNKSEMDGVCDAAEIVEAAFAMGHKAVAITDHSVTQAFPIAQRTAKGLLKKHPDREFKILYGCELNMVDRDLEPVYNAVDLPLSKAEYIVFDLETTGLSSRHDRVIEFGAVHMVRGNIVDTRDFFLNPGMTLPEHIRTLTNIRQEDVDQARTFAEAKDELLDFLKGKVLVAHNASFDFGFLNEELKRLGLPKLENPVIDTLDLSRMMLKNLHGYRLGRMAKHYGIDYDEEVAHRANYDAECLAKVFNLMLRDLQGQDVKNLLDFGKLKSDLDYVKKSAYHTTVLCRDKAGLKDLFKLVSYAHTDTLAVMGGGSAEPRVLREVLDQHRSHLLLGSGCQNGEVFQIASTRDEEKLAEAISYYDYIELQPLENYKNLVVDRDSYSWENIRQFQRDIIAEAKKQGKPVVASGDLHYVRRDEKILRDVYINTLGIGGTHHPLFVFNKERRAAQISPDQRFLNTNEMKEAFAWLNDTQLVYEMVVKNPEKIADMCEAIDPIHDKLYTPVIEGCVEDLKRVVYETAHNRYGDPLPEEFEARIKRELDSIIGNGYAVIYYVSHLLVKKSNSDGYLVGSRGSVGSSLVATMSGITEVNPMPPHYICPHCHHLEWADTDRYASGYDLPDKNCPVCGEKLIGDGQNIPFETFLGFHGDKVPDIDLNFSGDYQPTAHLFTREIFGEDHVFRAGTISTVAEKTAFGYVSGYCEEKGISGMSRAQRQRLASGCEGVKRTTGQHPGGIIVIPSYMDVYDFTPVQYPANDPSSVWKTTHFDFHEIHDNVLKFDILGHVDPTAMRQLQTISGIDPKSIPMNDPEVMSLFNSSKALNIINPDYHEETGACGLPEFGTRFVRGILEETRPSTFSDLVIISGLSHGTDVWNNNAKDLIDANIVKLQSVIGCRDDIMLGLMKYGMPSKASFDIMENVRKGKVAKKAWGAWEDHKQMMREHNVPNWYIESCEKIQYMFPKAHAVAYVIMAVRIAWFKVHYPEYYYVSFFSLRCDAYEIETMIQDAAGIRRRMEDIEKKMRAVEKDQQASKKEKDLYDTLEICYEMVSRGYQLTNIDLDRSLATEFRVDPDDHHKIIPPFTILDGLGANVGESIVKARNERPFLSKEDLSRRTLLSNTLRDKLEKLGALKGLDDTDQMTLF
ncbi:MAG: PolC-type DNA polymerase III [Erysipelotrichaceae bacterium]|nr:PolC-type DNA polymerase III [Erysipelotrichaceae bacterium]